LNRRFALAANCLDGWRVFSKLGVAKRILNQAEDFPRWVLRLFQTCNSQNQHGGETKGNIPMNPLIQLKKATPLFLAALVLGCFALPSATQAVPSVNVVNTPERQRRQHDRQPGASPRCGQSRQAALSR
jgi:hypothetical protein